MAADGVLLTSKEAAQRLKISENTLHRWRYSRKGPPYVKLGRAVRYRAEDLDSFIESARAEP